MSQTRTRALHRRSLNNKLFVALLSSLLVLLLAAVAMVLLSNVYYLATGRTPQGETGWQVLLASLRDPGKHFSIRLSIITASITTLLAMIIGVPAAYVLSRYRLPGATFWDTILDLPIVLPPPVMGLSLLILFSTPAGGLVVAATRGLELLVRGWLNLSVESVTGEWAYTQRGIVIAQFFVACPFGVRAVKAAFDTIGSRHEQVARTLGCTQRQAFWKVVLPMARTGIVAGAVMTWARAIAEFGPILFFCGTTQGKTDVMPVSMFLDNSVGRIEHAVALVLIMIAISTVTLVTFKKLGGQGYLW